MDIVPTVIVLYLWCTCRGQSQSPIFTVLIFSIELRPCLLSIFFGKYTVCSSLVTPSGRFGCSTGKFPSAKIPRFVSCRTRRDTRRCQQRHKLLSDGDEVDMDL